MFARTAQPKILTLPIVVLLAAGCGGGDAGSGGSEGGGAASSSQPAASSVDPATAGHISGMVTFAGMPPSAGMIDMAEEPTCAEKHGDGGAMTETVVVGPDGGLANVFLYVKEGLSGQTFPTPEAAVLDQDGCVYHPHVLGLQIGQDMIIRNSDGLLHNINASPSENRPFNVSQPVNMDTERSFRSAEVMIPLRCDVHGWMSAYVGVLEHPYHSVSGADGAFSLETLPPGDYVIEAWHEAYGTLTQNVTVATGETAQISFEFTEDMAGNHVPLAEPWTLRHNGAHAHADGTDPM